MPNSLKETIKQLRKLILSKVEKTCGFSSDNIPEGRRAKHTSGQKIKDSDSWESLLLEWDTIKIFLKYDKGSSSKSDNFDDAQKIILHGNEFVAVRLAIYDEGKIANFSIKIKKQNLFDKLGNRLPHDGRVYEIEKSSGEFGTGKNSILGHVLVLHIKATGETWDIGANLNPDQFEKASADLVDKVAATLQDLLLVAKDYADKREAILSGKI